ncbi:hypothetical protein [Acinetobacter sp. CFCC 10889]|uniref:hypothetical protein n=1 Tax=Acinetobacter sp. CFCC 10889 TaxID=1775557 RepID=UPI000DD08A22|nr:hypothetical protein [Acinetobacter sp. CFCC 10889]
MPKVKYLKDLCSGRAGKVCDLTDFEANILVQLGAVEIIDENAGSNTRELLLNLNGSPVVDDFGAFVEVPEAIESTAKKGRKLNKG